MRARYAVIVLLSAVTACARLPTASFGDASSEPSTLEPQFIVRPFPSGAAPSPMVQVQAGVVEALIPQSWEARPLPEARLPQRGFVAAPRISDWDEGSGVVRGMEAYWIDVAEVRIPSDLYYLVARGPATGTLAAGKSCRAARHDIVADNPPDLSGHAFSPGDYVAAAEGTCKVQGKRTRWAYVVVAPGFGPARAIGIPSSGLYVVIAVVSGSRSGQLLQEIMRGARFGNASISQIVSRAGTAQ